jgi:hypothetical protein
MDPAGWRLSSDLDATSTNGGRYPVNGRRARLDARQVIRNGQLVRSNAVATPLQSIVWAPVPLLLAQKYDAEESG